MMSGPAGSWRTRVRSTPAGSSVMWVTESDMLFFSISAVSRLSSADGGEGGSTLGVPCGVSVEHGSRRFRRAFCLAVRFTARRIAGGVGGEVDPFGGAGHVLGASHLNIVRGLPVST